MTALTSFIRHLIGMALGGFLAQGIITADQVEIIITSVSAVVGVVALVGWSYIEKKITKKDG